MEPIIIAQLKVLVERVVRPIRASTACKHKMREELLAHLADVYEEESAKLADERQSLAETARRFGNVAELRQKLQESVPPSDWSERLVERLAFRPGEATWRRAMRHALLSQAYITIFLIIVIFLFRRAFYPNVITQWWPVLFMSFAAFLGVFVWTFLVAGMCRALYSSKRPLVMGAIVAAAGCAFLFPVLQSLELPSPLGLLCVPALIGLAKVTDLNNRHHHEWDCLNID